VRNHGVFRFAPTSETGNRQNKDQKPYTNISHRFEFVCKNNIFSYRLLAIHFF